MVTKKILLYTDSCRDGREGKPFAVRHLDFDNIWLKVELGEIFDITFPPCLDRKLKVREAHQGAGYRFGGGGGALQDAGHRFEGGGGGGFDSNKRGREQQFKKNGNLGETVHNKKLKKNLMIKGDKYGSLIHNFISFRDNKKWVPTRHEIPLCLKYHCVRYCKEKCMFEHKELNAKEEDGVETLFNKARDLKISDRKKSGGGDGAGF